MNIPNQRPSMILTFTELIDRTFRIYRENFVPMVSFVALVVVPISIMQLILTLSSGNPLLNPAATRTARLSQSAAISSFSGLFSIIASIVEVVLVNGVLVYMASESQLGRKASVADGFRLTRQRFASLGCGITLGFTLLFIAVVLVAILTAFCAPLVVGIALVVYLSIGTFAFFFPVLTLENVRMMPGINRAMALGKTRFWRMIGVLMALYGISTLFSLAFSLIVQLFVFQMMTTSYTTATVIESLFTTLVSIFLTPVLPIGLTLLYYDTRARFEGLDIALQTLDTPNPRPSDLASPPISNALNRRDWLNIAIITATVLVIGLAFAGAFQQFVTNYTNSLNLPR